MRVDMGFVHVSADDESVPALGQRHGEVAADFVCLRRVNLGGPPVCISGGLIAKEKDGGIYFKVSEHDRQLIEQKMELAYIRNMSAYIRKMCIDGYTVNLEIPELDACAKYLRKQAALIMILFPYFLFCHTMSSPSTSASSTASP